MTPRILEATHVKDFVIHIRFADGAEGDVDLKDELDGPIFRPLKNPKYFAKFALHPELRTITWPNGADFAPEFLYEIIHVSA
jgi:hypothetical protein